MGGEVVDLVDGRDEVIGTRPRDALAYPDTFRVAALWLLDGAGRLLLAQRHPGVRSDPGAWGPSVAGTVRAGETYRECVVREAAEEIGVAVRPAQLRRQMFDSGRARFFVTWFTAPWDGTPLLLAAAEVAAARWVTREQLDREVRSAPGAFVTGASTWLPHLADLPLPRAASQVGP